MNTTEVVALITAASTLLAGFGGTWLRARYERQRSVRQERVASYDRLSVATRVLAVRAVVYRDRGSVPTVLARTMEEHTNFVPTAMLMALPKIRDMIGVSGAVAVAQSLPSPQFDPPAATLGTVTEAFEEVIAAASAVHLRGSGKAIEAADALLKTSGEFVELRAPKSSHPQVAQHAPGARLSTYSSPRPWRSSYDPTESNGVDHRNADGVVSSVVCGSSVVISESLPNKPFGGPRSPTAYTRPLDSLAG